MIAEEMSVMFQALGLEEITELRQAVNSLQTDAMIINVGPGAGTSAIAMCEARPDCTIYSVGLENSLYERERGIEFAERCQLVQLDGGSLHVAQAWWRGPVDLVFIDAEHTYEACKADFVAWDQLLRIGGFMIFHDNNPAVFPGVVKVLEEVDAMPERYCPVSAVDVTRVFRKLS